MQLVSIDLTLVTTSGMIETISLHSGPVISCSQNLFGHGVSTRMCSKGTLIHLFYNCGGFVFVHASEQYKIMISLVKNITIQEKLGRKFPQGLFIMIETSSGYS